MAWFRLDDRAAFHRKLLAAGNEAVGAWVRAGIWSAGEGTDGFIPTNTALTIAPAAVWETLLKARAGGQQGLVEVAVEGWQIHDFLVYNPSAQEVRDERERISKVRAEAGRRGGLQRAAAAQLSDEERAMRTHARTQVTLALKRGDLRRLPCDVCGAEETEAHHDDYSQALTVRWLCQQHHRELHTERRRTSKSQTRRKPNASNDTASGQHTDSTSIPSSKQDASVLPKQVPKQNEAPIPIPIPISDPPYPPERDAPSAQGDPGITDPDNPPDIHRRSGASRYEESYWKQSYIDVVTIVLGRPWAFPDKELASLRNAVETYAVGPDLANRDGWVRREAAAFVGAVRDEGKYWSSFGPNGFLKWLNDDRPGHRSPGALGPAGMPRNRKALETEADLDAVCGGPVVRRTPEDRARLKAIYEAGRGPVAAAPPMAPGSGIAVTPREGTGGSE